MAALELKSTNEFVRSSDEGLLAIYELELDAPNSYGVKKENWSFMALVVPKKATLAIKGASIQRQMLEKLQKDLHHWHLSVNCEGLCYLEREAADTFFNVEYCRLNDLFSWSDYVEDQENQDYKFKEGVKTVWNRCDMRDGEVLLNYELKEKTLEALEKNAKEKEEELDKKEKELENVKEESKATHQLFCSTEAKLKEMKKELEIKDKKINDLKDQHSSDKTKLKSIKEELQKKEKELNESQNRLSSTHAEKVKELEKVKEGLEIKDKVIKDFKDQLSSNITQLKSIKEELQKKEKELNEVQYQFSSTHAEKLKQLENVKEEAKKLGKKYSITETELNVKKRELELKDKELQELKDKLACSEELEKKYKELTEVKDQLSSAQAKLKSRIEEMEKELESLREKVREQGKELERNGLSSTTGSTCVYIFLDIVLRRRLPLAPEKFKYFTGNLNTEAFKFPSKGETLRIYTPLDTDQHKIGVNINRARYTSDGQWDKKNWWLITVSEYETHPFTIAFYGGNFDSTEAYGTSIGIPFHKGATFKNDSNDQVSFVRGIGMRFLIAFGS